MFYGYGFIFVFNPCPGNDFLRRLRASERRFDPPGISQVLEHIATKFQQLSPYFRVKLFNGATSVIAWRQHLLEIQDGGRKN